VVARAQLLLAIVVSVLAGYIISQHLAGAGSNAVPAAQQQPGRAPTPGAAAEAEAPPDPAAGAAALARRGAAPASPGPVEAPPSPAAAGRPAPGTATPAAPRPAANPPAPEADEVAGAAAAEDAEAAAAPAQELEATTLPADAMASLEPTLRVPSTADESLPAADGPAAGVSKGAGGFARLAPPGELTRVTWRAGESTYGAPITTPVLVAQGREPGPVLCLTAAIHGDELNGIETVRRLMYSVDPEKLAGRIVGVPIVNLQGFERHSRYLPDRRDLNRFFPGNPTGSAASRMAHSFFQQVIMGCDALVDLHTGSFHRTNLPQLRADLNVESVVALTQGFESTVVLHSEGGEGTLRRAAVDAGIPAVTLEAGEPLRVDDDAVEHSVKALLSLLDQLDMYGKRGLWGRPQPRYYQSVWVRADKGGMLLGEVKLGRRVATGDVLGTVTDPITNERQIIRSPYDGRVIGMALNQFVMPGYAAFHLGTDPASLDDLPDDLEDPDMLDHSLASADGPDGVGEAAMEDISD